MSRHRALSVILLVCILATGCAARPAPTVAGAGPMVITRGSTAGTRYAGDVLAQDGTTSTGMVLRLSEGSEEAVTQPAVPVTSAQPLSDAQVQQLLGRLEPLPALPGDTQDFALPPASLPAPRPGTTIQEPFPPPPAPITAPEVTAGPLEVLRYAPEGDVALAPYLNVTFNQPMVPLTGLQDLAALEVPVRLSPLPPGDWRWLGTKTLMFQPQAAPGAGAGRLPMATKFTAEIPAGTQSASGSKLAAAVTWTFTTPPPIVQSSYPPAELPQPLEPLMFVSFDQRIDPAAVLATIKVKAGAAAVPVRLATAAEIKADEAVQRLVDAAAEGRWLAFRAQEPLPAGTAIGVTIGPGTPSTEGPLKTGSAQNFGFRTYDPLAVAEYGCGWDNQCPPMTPWRIRFNNPLDEAAFTEDYLKIKPALPGVSVNVFADMVVIQGRSSGRTKYLVTLSGKIRDQFGQTLGKDQVLTFDVGSAEPVFWAPGGEFVVLDPSAKPAYSVYTINFKRLKVQAYAVQPEDWPAYKAFVRAYYQTDKPPAPPGKQVLNQTVEINGRTDELAETAIDLAPALSNGLGHLVIIVQPEVTGLTALFPWLGNRPPVAHAWVEATHIGLDAFVDANEMTAWANSLADGAPLPGVQLSLQSSDRKATTDDRGLATLQLPDGRAAGLLVGRIGADVAILPNDLSIWGEGGWQRRPQGDVLRWYVFDDRGMYRPDEEVHIKGWLRRVGGGKNGDVGPLMGAAEQVHYRVIDSRGNEVGNGTADLNALGGFDFAFMLNKNMNLGYTMLELTALGGSGGVGENQTTHPFQVQEFRRPEFEVKAQASEGPHFVGGHATTEVSATYYAGGGLPNADVTWNVTTAPGHYSPPGWDEFTFGKWVPWWRDWGAAAWGGPGYSIEGAGQVYTGRTDAAGIHRLRLDFESVDPPEPTSVTAQATVMDVNRQAWTATTVLLVHPSALYVGLRSDRVFVEREQPIQVDAIVTDLDGKPVAGQEIAMRAARLEWKYQNGTWQEVEAASQPCTVKSAAEPVRCTFETPEGGTYLISATVTDDQGRPNRSELTRWVSGGQRPPARQVEQETVTLIPDSKEYQPGDTAEILVQSPFYPAEGLVTMRRSGMVSEERFTMDGPTYTLRVPIEEAHIPNVHVQVDLVGAAPRTDDSGKALPDVPKRPAFAIGELDLPVPPMARVLSVEATPRDADLEPGGKTVVNVVVRDAAEKPVAGAELAVVVVDEAVLALSNYQLADPIATFYQDRSGDVSDHHLRSSVLLAAPDLLGVGGAEQASQTVVMEKMADSGARGMAFAPAAAPAAAATEAPAAAGNFGGPEAAPIAIRLDFNPLATFAPAVPTDANGRAQVEVKVPDNLTRYRVMVVAVAGGKYFGKAESSITARMPLMVRPSPPRFLNFGDRFELPVVLQNQTNAPMQVDVAVRAANAVLTDGAGWRVTVPARDRVEVRFPTATARAGTARFQVAAASGKWSDAAQFELPVWTPATTEAFAVYGEVDQGAIAQPVIAPTGVYTQFGGLEITTSSTALQALTDAMLYLQSYPFECSEQLASRILSVAALRDVLTAFSAEGLPPPDQIEAAMARDIERLRGMQNDDGGFGLWRRGDESWPYHSIHVTNALQRAKQKGYAVSEDMLARAQSYLRDIESYIPPWYGADARRTLIAYALDVRKQMGDADPARARRLIQEAGLEKLSPEAIGWILPVLSDDPGSKEQVAAIRRHLQNRVTETAGTAHFVADYGDDGYLLLYSDRRADGIILDAMIGDQPESDLIPKIVRGLLAHRKAGHWANTQEDVFILLALDRYFNTYEAITPDFVARAWLGEQYVGEAAFYGRTTEYREINVPMRFVAEQPGTQNLVLSKEGPGRLYYRLGMRYAPTDLNLPPADQGFTVLRTYEAVDNPDDLHRDAVGVWHVKAGARVRVRLTMVAPARRYHVALMDPLPAGFEALNPALAVTGSIPRDPSSQENRYGWWWWSTWYEHQNLRDERAEAFASLLWEGVYTYSYVARATTPGQYVVPPAKAEEMYMPETFGRAGTDRVVVE